MGLTEEEIQDAKARAVRDPDQNAAEDLQREQDRQTFIWGTAISVDDVQNRFRRFLENFILTKKDKQVKEGEGDDEDDEGGERNNAGDGEKDDGTNGSAEKRNEGAMDTDNNNNNNNEKDTDANAGKISTTVNVFFSRRKHKAKTKRMTMTCSRIPFTLKSCVYVTRKIT